MKTLLLICLLPLTINAATLEWDRNPETNVIGYRVYVGVASRDYYAVLDIGNQITTQVPTEASTTYFAVTAYDSDGLESDYSKEVFYTKLVNPSGIPNYALTNVTIRVPSGKYYVERANTVSAWVALSTITGPTNIVFPITGTMGFFRYRPYFVSVASPKSGATKLMARKQPMFAPKPIPITPVSRPPTVIGPVNLDPSKR